MKLIIDISEFESRLCEFREVFKTIQIKKVDSEVEVQECESLLEETKASCAEFVDQSFQGVDSFGFGDLIRYEDRFNLQQNKDIAQLKKELRDRAGERARTLNYLLKCVKLSDPLVLGRSFSIERSSLTVEEKSSFLLSKLYELKKSDGYWDTEMIFELNQVELDNYNEAREITTLLKDYGYVDCIGLSKGLSAKITAQGKLFWEENNVSFTNTKQFEQIGGQTSMEIFISHSSADSELAELLVDLLKASLNLSASSIRCTSVNGYRLQAGADTNETLKREVHDSKVLLGLISPSSMSSAYVMFELGARWGASLPLIPVLTSVDGVKLLQGPLSGINALTCCETGQVHQLISELKKILNVVGESPEVYESKLNEVVKKASQPSSSNGQVDHSKAAVSSSKVESSSNTDDKIKSYCTAKWPDDYAMRVHCIKEQRSAALEMNSARPGDIPETTFNEVIEKAIRSWPNDFTMQVHSRNEQLDAYRELSAL